MKNEEQKQKQKLVSLEIKFSDLTQKEAKELRDGIKRICRKSNTKLEIKILNNEE